MNARRTAAAVATLQSAKAVLDTRRSDELPLDIDTEISRIGRDLNILIRHIEKNVATDA